METFRSAKHLADEKQLDRIMPTHSSQKVLPSGPGEVVA
jgi:hypothetical protein